MSDVRLTATNPEDSSAVLVACNSKGELLLEEIPDQSFDGDLEGDLTVSGDATFAGDVYCDGRVGCGVTADTNPAAYGLTSRNNFDATSNASAVTAQNFNGVGRVWCGINSTGINTSEIFANGSAVFGSKPNNSNATGVGILAAGAAVDVQADGRLWRGHKYETGAETSSIDDDGSAEFQGDVIVGSRSKKWTLVEQGGLCHMIEATRAATADLVEPDDKYPKLRDVFHELDLIEQALEQVMTKLRLDPPAGWPVWDGSDNLSATD